MKTLKKTAFYLALVAFLRNRAFDEPAAESLVKLYEEAKTELSCGEITIEFLRRAHCCAEKNYFQPVEDGPLVDELAESAFKDLAPHMRDPKVYEAFSGLVGDISQILYAHIANVRHLGGESLGKDLAVVTVVVSSYGLLRAVLKDQPRIITTYLSEEPSRMRKGEIEAKGK